MLLVAVGIFYLKLLTPLSCQIFETKLVGGNGEMYWHIKVLTFDRGWTHINIFESSRTNQAVKDKGEIAAYKECQHYQKVEANRRKEVVAAWAAKVRPQDGKLGLTTVNH
jgi:hypothetical protein